VFDEAFRVLKPEGRLAVADMVATAPLPEEIKSDWAAYTGCMAGASQITELQRMLEASGFKNIQHCSKGFLEVIHSRMASRQADRRLFGFRND